MSTTEMSLNNVPATCSAYQSYRDPLGESDNDCEVCENMEPAFCKWLTKFYRDYVETADPVDETEFIRRSMNHFERYLQHKRIQGRYTEFKLGIFEKFRTTNYDVIQDALAEIIILKIGFSLLPETAIEKLDLPRAEYYYFRYRRILPNLNVYYIHIDIAVFKDFTAMQWLLRYGIRLKSRYTGIIGNIAASIYDFRFRDNRDEERTERIDSAGTWALMERYYPTDYSKKRLFFLSLLLQFTLTENECDYLSCIKSLDLFLETVPDPLITLDEISRFLTIVLPEEGKDNFIRDVCEKFAEEFPESKDPLHPRRLTHLCRCTVRNCLIENKKLPHGVWSLGLPKKIVNYILIQRNENEFDLNYASELFTSILPNSCDSLRLEDLHI